jgi:acetyl-CoA C-acetyltransferase
MAAGELDCALIVGAEAMRSRRRAGRENRELPWPARPDGVSPIRGQRPFSSDLEQRHGLVMPIQAFPLFENAIGHANGRSPATQSQVAAELLARNAKVAAANPYAWFRDAPSAEDIATVTRDNRLVAFPYTKRMNAIMDVNQAAAVVVVSARLSGELGLAERSAVLLGGSGAEDPWFLSERNTFTESPAMNQAVAAALAEAGLESAQIDAMDLYSCFPSAIQMGLTALDSGPTDPRPLSLTGGLAFAGGPGNAYVLHSLASAITRLRTAPTEKVLITGIGMSNTKHAATVLTGAAHEPADASGITHYRRETGIQPAQVTEQASGKARVLSFTVEFNRDATPARAIFMLELEDGSHTVANAPDGAQLSDLMHNDPIGRRGELSLAPDGRNHFQLGPSDE